MPPTRMKYTLLALVYVVLSVKDSVGESLQAETTSSSRLSQNNHKDQQVAGKNGEVLQTFTPNYNKESQSNGSKISNPRDSSHVIRCPVWFYNTSSGCVCGSDLKYKVDCNQTTKEVFLLNCNCMTYDYYTQETIAGSCTYGCKGFYRKLPEHVDNLNSIMCGYLNREGRLCGNCRPGHMMPQYTYDTRCVKCSYKWWNWLIYLSVAYIPLTLFFVVIVSCRVSATSKQLHAFVLVAQVLSNPVHVRAILVQHKQVSFLRVGFALYGVWNLDFFRSLTPPICLNVSSLQGIILDYAIGFYPLILILVTYILVELRERNFKPVLLIWMPMRRCFACIHRQWDIKTSMVDAFATFLVLSYLKLLSVSFDVLVPTTVYNIHGKGRLYLLQNATIEYFGSEHLPYGILAIVVLVVFNILPLFLLLLYPLRSFQRCLSCLGLRTRALAIFMDAFQGHYKDGTNGSLDTRYFASTHFILMITIYIISGFVYNVMFYPLAILPSILCASMFAIFQPYKTSVYNNITVILILSLTVTGVFLFCYIVTPQKFTITLTWIDTFTGIFGALPLVYVAGLTIYWIICRRKLLSKLRCCILSLCGRQPQDVSGSFRAVLPDRLRNPQRYGALLSYVAATGTHNTN